MNLKPQCLCPQEPESVMILIIQSFNTLKGTDRPFFLRGVTAVRGGEMASTLYVCCWEDFKDLCFGKRTIQPPNEKWTTSMTWRIRVHLASILEKAMVPHSSTLAWKIPVMEEPGRLQSMGSLRVGHHWANSLTLFTFLHWRRKWQPTPVFLPGESQGRGSLVGCCLWGRTELDTTEVT